MQELEKRTTLKSGNPDRLTYVTPDTIQPPLYTVTTHDLGSSRLFDNQENNQQCNNESLQASSFPETERIAVLPSVSGIVSDTDWRKALSMPVSPVHIYSGPVEVFRRILDPARIAQLSETKLGRIRGSTKKGARLPEKHLELPRGKFRALKRSTILLFLLKDLSTERFTGYCNILSNNNTMVLVFRDGTALLAACDNLGGDLALKEICSYRYSRVDVMLHDLDKTQIRLALEFNSAWKIVENYAMLQVPHEIPEKREESISTAGNHSFGPESTIQDGSIHTIEPHSEPFNTEPSLMIIEPIFRGSDQEVPGWKKAIEMEITPGTNHGNSEELSSGIITVPLSSGSGHPLMFETLTSESDLFEQGSPDLKSRKKTVPELKELWKSMHINNLENNSV